MSARDPAARALPAAAVYGAASGELAAALTAFGIGAAPGPGAAVVGIGAAAPVAAADPRARAVVLVGAATALRLRPGRPALVIAAPGMPAPERAAEDRGLTWRLLLDAADPASLERPHELYGVLEAIAAFLHVAHGAAYRLPRGSAPERRPAILRRTHLGAGALRALGPLLAAAERPVAIVSPSAPPSVRAAMQEAAGGALPMLERPAGQLTQTAVDLLGAQLAERHADLVLGLGGGTVLDAAKATGVPAGRTVVLLPTTLSGSEHTGNAAIWRDGRKTVNRVGLADAVVADPDLLAGGADALVPTALHAMAHTLTILGGPDAASPTLAAMAATALSDLLPPLEAEDLSPAGRLQLVRGAWNAAVAIGLTGPRFGPHHELAHRLVRPDRPHARVSAALLCATLLRSSLHDPALEAAEQRGGPRATRVRDAAARWAPRLRDAGGAPRDVDLATIPLGDRATCRTMLEALLDVRAR